MRLVLLLLIALPLRAFSQVGLAQPAKPICFTLPQAKIIQDSLKALPLVRKSATFYQRASTHNGQQADSLRAGNIDLRNANLNLIDGLNTQKIETTRARLDAKQWKGKAIRRGVLNWLLIVGAAAGGGFLIAH